MWLVWCCLCLPAGQVEPCVIRIIDSETQRGVPLVELKTVNQVRYYTDSNGVVTVTDPGLFGQQLYFHIRSHGYEYRADGFGFRGQRIALEAGKTITLQIQRKNLAERLYRVTGADIYRDSMLAGMAVPIKHPRLNGQVYGSDSVVNAVYRGEIYWFWGDTNRPSYPLGNFHVPGATSVLPDKGGLSPQVGVDLRYFLDKKGFAKPTCQMPGSGPTWIDGLITVKEETGRERLLARYVKVRPPLTIYETGLVQFDDQQQQFSKVCEFEKSSKLLPTGHPFLHKVGSVTYAYFGRQIPHIRVPASPTSIADLQQYESYTYYRQGSSDAEWQLDRDASGNLQYAWRSDTIAPTPKREQQLIADGLLTKEEACCRLVDVETGKRIQIHSSSVAWNEYRQKWTMIALETFGSSPLGEVWYAEAPQPEGPWSAARKVVTHDRYSFYNPRQHAMLAEEGGRFIYFEGTYTSMFSGNPDKTPRYDYNQVMYRLDLKDERLNLANASRSAEGR